MDSRTKQSLKDRDRVNPYYIPDLEGHQNPILAATLPHIEVVLILSLVFAGGIIGALAGKLLLVDLAQLDPVWRILLFLGFGATLLGLGYLINRPRRSESTD